MKPTILRRLTARKYWLPMLAGGFALQFGGCDPSVRDTVLAGFQSSLVGLVTAILNAFFLSLTNSTGSTSQSVVQAGVETLRYLLA